MFDSTFLFISLNISFCSAHISQWFFFLLNIIPPTLLFLQHRHGIVSQLHLLPNMVRGSNKHSFPRKTSLIKNHN